MLDSWNFPIGVVLLKTIKPVNLIIYLQTLKTYLDLKTPTEFTLTISLWEGYSTALSFLEKRDCNIRS